MFVLSLSDVLLSKWPVTVNACATAAPLRLSMEAVDGSTVMESRFGPLPNWVPPSPVSLPTSGPASATGAGPESTS